MTARRFPSKPFLMAVAFVAVLTLGASAVSADHRSWGGGAYYRGYRYYSAPACYPAPRYYCPPAPCYPTYYVPRRSFGFSFGYSSYRHHGYYHSSRRCGW